MAPAPTPAVMASTAYQTQPTRTLTIRNPRSASPARPDTAAVTTTAATAGPSKPGRCVGHVCPARVVTP